MSYEMKRVPMDFDYPIGLKWKGYINPYIHMEIEDKHDSLYMGGTCEDCDGSGYSSTAQYWKDLWYGYIRFNPEMNGSKPFSPDHPHILKLATRNTEWLHEKHNRQHIKDTEPGLYKREVYTEQLRLASLYNGQMSHHLRQDDVDALLERGRLQHHFPDGHVPTVEEVNEMSVTSPMFHDSISEWVVTAHRCERAGMDPTCSTCGGDGHVWHTGYDQYVIEKWERIDPPSGDGYQLWETISEGSPVSPVIETADEMIQWIVANREGIDIATATKFVSVGFAPSMSSEVFPDGTGQLLVGINAVNHFPDQPDADDIVTA